MNQDDTGAQFAAQQHLNTVKTQETIIRGQQVEIDSLNAKLLEKEQANARLKAQVVELEDRLQHPNAPMNRSTGYRCPICCAKSGERHLSSCPEQGS